MNVQNFSKVSMLLSALLLTGCSTPSTVYVPVPTPLPLKPSARQPLPLQPYSKTAQDDIERWQKMLTATQATSKP